MTTSVVRVLASVVDELINVLFIDNFIVLTVTVGTSLNLVKLAQASKDTHITMLSVP